jgi:outer membrane lipoprotein-sorting protein
MRISNIRDISLFILCTLASPTALASPVALASPTALASPAALASPTAIASPAAPASSATETASEVIDRVTAHPGKTEQVEVTMDILNADGSEKEPRRIFEIQGQYSANGKDFKTLVSFVSPRGIKDTRILMLKSGGTTGEWIYLPALKKASRINSDEDVEGIMDSDLSYQDIKGESTEDYSYSFNAGKTVEYADKICGEPAHSISAVSKEKGSAYSKRTLSISKSKSVVCGVLLYDKSGKLVKSIENSAFSQVGGSWRPGKSVISSLNPARGVSSKTVLTYTDWKAGMKLEPSLFTVNSLSR